MLGKTGSAIEAILSQVKTEAKIKNAFLNRLQEGNLTRDENQLTHFCVYFAAYDPRAQEVFLGHHIKSGLWLFNGGHIDQGEMPSQAVQREISEEWGSHLPISVPDMPQFLTITKINNPAKQKCRTHYDIWYFLPLEKSAFIPDPKLLATEFHQTGWKNLQEAKNLVVDPNTLLALKKVADFF